MTTIKAHIYFLGNKFEKINGFSSSLDKHHYSVRTFDSLEQLYSSGIERKLSALFIDQNISPSQHELLALKRKLITISSLRPLLVMIGEKDDFEARRKYAHAGIDYFFHDTVSAYDLLQCLEQNIKESNDPKPRVLFIENPNCSLASYRKALSNENIKTRLLVDHQKLIPTLNELQPHIVIINFNLEASLTIDIAKIIRQNTAWHHIRLICLIDGDKPQQQNEAIDAGFDIVLLNPVPLPLLKSIAITKTRRSHTEVNTHNSLRSVQRERDYQNIALNEHAIISTTSADGRITDVNDKFCELSGYSRGELLGQNHRMLKSGYHTPAFYAHLWQTIKAGKVWHGIICNKNKDGHLYWSQSTIVPFLDKHDRPYKFVSVRTDITEIRSSERRFHLSQTYANIGMWDWNIQTGVLFWSDQIAPLFGFSDSIPETTYKAFLASVHPEDRKLVSDAVNQCIHQGKKYDIEHRVVWPDGSIHWMHERGNVERSENGSPLHMLGIVEDITSKKACEFALIEQEKRLLDAQHIGKIGDWYWDREEGQINMSEESRRIAGLFPGETSNYENMLSKVHKDDYEIISQAQQKALEHGYSSSDYRIVLADKHFRWVHSERHAVVNDSGKIIGLRGTLQDITERKHSEQKLVEAKEESERANQAKSVFLSSMSHELRTPLNAIMGFAQLLEMNIGKNLSSQQLENIGEILNASNHLLNLINEILELAKIESGKIQLTVEALPVNEVIRECIELVNPLARKNHVNIIWDYKGNNQYLASDKAFNPIVLADRTRLKQVIINLLSNAIKYNHKDGNVTISYTNAAEQKLAITVSDTGVGLNKDQQTQLFDAFNRLGAESLNKEGAGIGLVISKNLIELMNGEIHVESEPEKGSSFQIQIPLAANKSTRGFSFDDELSVLNKQNQPTGDPQIQPGIYTILCIEDNPVNLRLIEKIINQLDNVEFICASDPLTGLGLSAINQPDLILLDINLPVINGFETLNRLRDLENNNPRVIAISAHAQAEAIQQAMDAGFHDYITKPININNLLSVINSNLARR